MGTSSFQRKISAPSQSNDKKETGSQQSSFSDNRESTDQITQLQSSVDNSSNIQEITQLQEKVDNNTGMPDDLKQGVEGLSGQDMSDVKVTYNSDKPAQLQAHAYAQGNNIHIAPGQEKYLPHEAWHVVQQKQGRVEPTTQLKGNVNVNDDAGLEKEADVMGAKAASFGQRKSENQETLQLKSSNDGVVQMAPGEKKKEKFKPTLETVLEEETPREKKKFKPGLDTIVEGKENKDLADIAVEAREANKTKDDRKNELKAAQEQSDKARTETSEAIKKKRIAKGLDPDTGEPIYGPEPKPELKRQKNASKDLGKEVDKPNTILEKAGGEVILKLKEHKKVIVLIKNLSVATSESGAIFWASHNLIFNDEAETMKMENHAMLMAQKLARDVKSQTLEMTEAGCALDKLAPFNELMTRFNFLYKIDGLAEDLVKNLEVGFKEDSVNAQKIIDAAIKQRKERLKTKLQSIILNQFDEVGLELTQKQRDEVGTAGTAAAGQMWNIISHKFGESVHGEVSSVHGVTYDFTLDTKKPNPDRKSPKEVWGETTWMKAEKAAVESRFGTGEGQVKSIVNFFTDQLFVTWANGDQGLFKDLAAYKKAYKLKYNEESKLKQPPKQICPNAELYLQTLKGPGKGFNQPDDQEFSPKVDVVSGKVLEGVKNSILNFFNLWKI